jgi:alcohol dehydrogenase/L-iditol 2-dehydrogenase
VRALVKYDNKPGAVEIRDVPIPEISSADVLLEVRAVGICGWDVEMWQHRMANPVTVPVIQGHEFCGVVGQIGKDVTRFKRGDRVVSETAAVICGKCRECLTGNYHLCSGRKGFGYGVDGAFTDYVKVPERCLHHIPENVSFEHASLTEPACVAYQAISVLSDLKPAEAVLIIGPGPVGLFCLQIAKASGAGPIYMAGTNKDSKRFELAKKLGADEIIDVSKTNAVEFINDRTNGEGIPLVIDAAGNKHSLSLAINSVARRGQITKIGWGPEPINLTLDPLLSKAAKLQGTFSHNWSTWEAVLSMLSQQMIQMGPMISHRITIDQWLEAFEAIERCEVIKAVMFFNE